MRNSSLLIAVIAASVLSACGKAPQTAESGAGPSGLVPVDVPAEDGSVVHGRAIYTVSNDQLSAMMKLLNSLWMPSAYAANGSTTVIYTNAGRIRGSKGLFLKWASWGRGLDAPPEDMRTSLNPFLRGFGRGTAEWAHTKTKQVPFSVTSNALLP